MILKYSKIFACFQLNFKEKNVWNLKKTNVINNKIKIHHIQP